MSYNQQKTLNGFDGVTETNVDDALEQRPILPPKKTAWSEHQYDVNAVRSPQPQYDELSPPPVPAKPWNSQEYATPPTQYEDLPPKPTYNTIIQNYVPARAYEEAHPAPTISPDDYIQIATTVFETEAERERKLFQETNGINTNPLHSTGDHIKIGRVSSVPAKPIYSPSYFQRFKTFVWSNAQRRIATVVITSLVIGGIIGAYLGISTCQYGHNFYYNAYNECAHHYH
jgi:hypothetical protein